MESEKVADMSLVLAADYEVPDFEQWQKDLNQQRAVPPALADAHIVIYRSVDDAKRIFVRITVRSQAVDALLRSPEVFEWFDIAGLEELPPVFAGRLLAEIDLKAPDHAGGDGVLVASIAVLPNVEGLINAVRASGDRMRSYGVRRYWVHRALDNDDEVMIMRDIATPGQARRWLDDPGVKERFLIHGGAGIYPPPFIGRPALTLEMREP
jgi:hypothetical protein